MASDACTVVAALRFAVASCALMACLAAAQPAPTVDTAVSPSVTDADLARAQRETPQVSPRDVEAAARRHPMPSDADLARVPVPTAPRLQALPTPHTRPLVDLQGIARGHERLQTAPAVAAGPMLLVFVSFAMPEAALHRLVDEAARCGATLVLRGLIDDSLTRTALRIQQLLGPRQVAFQIDPQAFDRFAVTASPTVVLLRTGAALQPCDGARCDASGAYVAAAGDVSLDYALAFFQRSAPSFAADAAALLQRLRK